MHALHGNLDAAKQHYINHGHAEGRDCTCNDGCDEEDYQSEGVVTHALGGVRCTISLNQ